MAGAVVAPAGHDGVPGGGKSLEVRFPKDFPGVSHRPAFSGIRGTTGTGSRWSPSVNTGFLYIGLHFRLPPASRSTATSRRNSCTQTPSVSGNAGLNHIPLNLRTADGGAGLYPAYEPSARSGCTGSPRERTNDVNDGRWHLLEVVQEPNTPGVKNGRIRIYLDGRLAGSWNGRAAVCQGTRRRISIS